MGQRLSAARLAAGFKNRKAACARYGFNINTYKSHEYGIRHFGEAEAKRYAEAYHVSVPYLLKGGTHESTQTVQSVPDIIGTNVVPDVPPERSQPEIPKLASPLADFTSGKEQHQAKRPEFVPSGTPIGTSVSSSVGPTRRHARVAGSCAIGIWLAPSGTRLYDPDTQVPFAPGHLEKQQYALQIVGNSASGTFQDGDFAIFLSVDPEARPPSGVLHVERRKSGLVENGIWNSDGRKLISDSSALDEQETIVFDPDDTMVAIKGVALAVYRPLPS